jgi:hypothetical protein
MARHCRFDDKRCPTKVTLPADECPMIDIWIGTPSFKSMFSFATIERGLFRAGSLIAVN